MYKMIFHYRNEPVRSGRGISVTFYTYLLVLDTEGNSWQIERYVRPYYRFGVSIPGYLIKIVIITLYACRYTANLRGAYTEVGMSSIKYDSVLINFQLCRFPAERSRRCA